MRKRIFRNTLFLSFAVLLSSIILIMSFMYNFYSNRYSDNLKNEAQYLRGGIELGGIEYLKSFDSAHRITLIDDSGKVLYDSEMGADALENHLDREEVKKAIKNGEGFSQRYSNTLSKKTVNYAVLLDNGNILRVSDIRYTLFSMLLSMWWYLLIVIVITGVLSFLLSYRISERIIKPINSIDLENPDESNVYVELTPLIKKISGQNEQLARQIRELSDEHEKQDKMRSEFTANVSHELKTPLTSISGYAEIIRDGIAKPEDTRRFAGKIYDESQRLITLVEDIIKLSQLDDKDRQVSFEDIDLHSACEQVISILQPVADKQNITLALSGEHLKIRGSEQIVEEMIYNLCDNAVKYNRKSGKVSISIRQCIDGVELAVSDTGIGIAQDDVDRIFERFYRVNKSHSKEIGGTGLGLSIVKHGAIFHSATVSVESKLGVGTTVRILF